jgi:ATP-dependent 26S proteasome regulatory subunit
MQQIEVAQASWEKEKKEELGKLSKSQKTYPEILVYLENEIETSKKMTTFDYTVPCFKNDGIYQLYRAIEEHVGASSVKAERGPSADGSIKTVDIKLADGTRKKIPYGKIDLPNMGEEANIDIRYNMDGKYLHVKGTCQFMFQTLIDKIIDRTNELLNTDSIYKSQAFEINENIEQGQPQIMDLKNINKEMMILSEETEYALSPLYARILHTKDCIKNNIPLKFGCLLEGPYGTGKTLLAFKLAYQAIQNNWSFIYLKSPQLLAETLRMSKTLDKNGNGIIVFVEDIDQVTKGDRNAAMQDILNTLDGGDTKNMNVIALFTTNHLELIEPTFLRGKRIGSIISMTYLNAATAKLYIDHFCEGVTLEGDFEPVYKLVEESNIAPAFMAEIIENVKSNMVIRKDTIVKASHFMVCIKSYLRQVELSKTKDTSLTKEQNLANSLKEVMHDEAYYEQIKEIVSDLV